MNIVLMRPAVFSFSISDGKITNIKELSEAECGLKFSVEHASKILTCDIMEKLFMRELYKKFPETYSLQSMLESSDGAYKIIAYDARSCNAVTAYGRLTQSGPKIYLPVNV